MLRVLLALCVFVALAHAVVLGNGPNYKVKTREIRRAADVVDQYLVDREYNVFEPELHYLVLVGVVNSVANDLASSCYHQDPQKLLLNALRYVLPEVLLNPNDTVADVQEYKNVTVKLLQPLLDLVDNVCDDLGSNECDRVVSRQVDNNSELKEAQLYLNVAYDVANGLLARQPRLVEVARSLNVVPYVVDNVVDASSYVVQLSRLLRLVRLQADC